MSTDSNEVTKTNGNGDVFISTAVSGIVVLAAGIGTFMCSSGRVGAGSSLLAASTALAIITAALVSKERRMQFVSGMTISSALSIMLLGVAGSFQEAAGDKTTEEPVTLTKVVELDNSSFLQEETPVP